MEKGIYDMLVFEDLTSDLEMIEEACGLETVKKMLKDLSGMSIYIPKITRMETLVLKYIKKNSEKSYKQIARELGVTDAYIKNLLRRRKTIKPDA